RFDFGMFSCNLIRKTGYRVSVTRMESDNYHALNGHNEAWKISTRKAKGEHRSPLLASQQHLAPKQAYMKALACRGDWQSPFLEKAIATSSFAYKTDN
ncbi:MAG: hypothetical protein ACOC43_16615, partial [Desulfohalobiaceae bacterium]